MVYQPLLFAQISSRYHAFISEVLKDSHCETAQFWTRYMDIIQMVLTLIRATRKTTLNCMSAPSWNLVPNVHCTWSHQLHTIYRGSYMSAHVLLNLLNELGKRDKMRGLPSILSLFHNEFNKLNNTRARMLDSIYHMANTLKSHFWRKTLWFCHHVRNVVMDVITFPVNR